MIEITPAAIEEYARQHSERESTLLAELAAETQAKMALPQMQVGHLEGAFLRFLVRATRARRILEIGSFTGYSSIVMAEALPPDGELITCDIDPKATEIARRYWAKSPNGHLISLRLGPALDTLKSLEGPFDLVFIDADKENYEAYWEACVPMVRQGGILLADNVLWYGRVLEPKEASDRAIVAFNQHVHNDPRVEAVLAPIRDGIMLAWKR